MFPAFKKKKTGMIGEKLQRVDCIVTSEALLFGIRSVSTDGGNLHTGKAQPQICYY